MSEVAFEVLIYLSDQLLYYIDKDSSDQNQIAAELKMSEDEIARGEYFECGCCFGDTGFSQCGKQFFSIYSEVVADIVVCYF